MQITIIGAGIAGLSAYLFLSKHLEASATNTYKIRIYESYQVQQEKHDPSHTSDNGQQTAKDTLISPRTIGVAIGIGKNGCAVLDRIDGGEVLQQITQRGNCISTWRMGTARGWKLLDAVVASSPGENGERVSRPTVMIARQAMWEVLKEKVQAIDPDAIVTAKVTEVFQGQNGKVAIRLDDGSERVADLIIGADGLRSVVRKAMFEHTKDTEPQTWWEKLLGKKPQVKDYITPHFVGLTGIGGTLPADVLRNSGFEDGAMAITFGPNGFFGHGYISPIENYAATATYSSTEAPPLAAWWSTFSSPTPYPFQTLDKYGKPIVDKEATLQNLYARHRNWKDPTIQAILDYIHDHEDKTLHTYPTYTTPELPTWHKNNIVLIGDAAHALQPSSGQGACQALEDSEALALLLSHYLNTQNANQDKGKAINEALIAFDTLRMPRLAKIYAQSSKYGKRKMDMNIVQELLMYFFIWLGSRLGMMKKYNNEVFEYDLPREVERVLKG